MDVLVSVEDVETNDTFVVDLVRLLLLFLSLSPSVRAPGYRPTATDQPQSRPLNHASPLGLLISILLQAVAAGAELLRVGGLLGAEYMAKVNRLLELAEELRPVRNVAVKWWWGRGGIRKWLLGSHSLSPEVS